MEVGADKIYARVGVSDKLRLEEAAETEGQPLSEMVDSFVAQWASLGSVPKELVDMLSSANGEHSYGAVVVFRKILCTLEDNSPTKHEFVQSVIEAGPVPKLVALVERHDSPALQFEAAWVLINMAAATREQAQVLVGHGAVPPLVSLLQRPDSDLRELGVWALGNVACDCRGRDVVLAHDVFEPLLGLLSRGNPTPDMSRLGTWALANMCCGGGRGAVCAEHARLAAHALTSSIALSQDQAILRDACRALFYLTDPDYSPLPPAHIFPAGLCQHLGQLLGHPSPAVRAASLGTVHNLVAGSDNRNMSATIDLNFLGRLGRLLLSEDGAVSGKACDTLVHITADARHGPNVIEAGLVPPLLLLGDPSQGLGDRGVQNAAACALSNALANGTREQVTYLVDRTECVPVLCHIMDTAEHRTAARVLEALDGVLDLLGGKGVHDMKIDIPGTGRVNWTMSLRKMVLDKRAALMSKGPAAAMAAAPTPRAQASSAAAELSGGSDALAPYS